MKRRAKHILGVLLAGALFTMEIYEQAPMVLTAEELQADPSRETGSYGEADDTQAAEEGAHRGSSPDTDEEAVNAPEDAGNTPEDAGNTPESTEEAPEDAADAIEPSQQDSFPEISTYGGLSRRSPEAVDEETAEWIRMAGEELVQIANEREIMALVYLSDEFPVRREPSYDSETEVLVFSGQMVNILDVYVDADFQVWEYVRLDYKGQEKYGYVPRTNLACSDSRFLAWEEQYGMNPNASVYAVDASGRTVYADIETFPESYRPALLALKQKHPNWVFAKMKTNLDWETAISQELGSKSLVHKSLADWMKEGLYDTGNWYYATEDALKLYMDPRNALTENAIFQFEQLTYNEEYHTEEAVKTFLDNTFMKSDQYAPGTVLTFSTIFWKIATEDIRKVSPFHLVARVVQEQGQGTSPLISGTYPGYEGYYNYFNIGATGKTNEAVILSGLEYAKNHGWKGAYYSILGGADFISGNYIKKGQDTLYLQKFNVNPNGGYPVYTHQYMQNISAPTTESANIRKLYANTKALENTFVFSIPVYENMPPEACGVPTKNTNVVLTMPKGYQDTTMWLDGVAYQGEVRNGNLIVSAPDEKAKTAVLYRYNESGVPVGMSVWSLSYGGMTYKATLETDLTDLLTYHGFSIRITGKSGIRFKTGISVALRNQLTTSGVNGYKLKEYGTLIMNNANRVQYPMIKGKEKVVESLAYGLDSSGTHKDVVFETVDGRHRYTSVLVGIPVGQYKTEYAFRGYIVLEKNGVQTVIYGPPVARSIYSLAEQLIERGSYKPDTDAYKFLKKLISDADALDKQPTVSGGDAAR